MRKRENMATWDFLKNSAKRMANNAIKETGEAADLAALHIKLKALESKRDDEYEMLGRLTYRQLKTGVSQAERIAPVIENLDKIRSKIKKTNTDIENTKLARDERRAQDKAAIALEVEEMLEEAELEEEDADEDDE